MKALRKIVDNLKPTFTRGGKLGFLASTFGAFETFLFVPNHTTKTGAHIRDCNDMKRTMIVVVLALLPAMLFGCFNTGLQVGLTGLTAFVYGLVRFLPTFLSFRPVYWPTVEGSTLYQQPILLRLPLSP